MTKIKNITGFEKVYFNILLKVSVFFKFLPDLFSGRFSIRKYGFFLKRLVYFISKLQHNKFVRIGKYTRIGLYIPGFPSKAFYTACRKFSVFDEKLPNSTVLLSVTSACRYDCEHCYQKNDRGHDIPIEKLITVVNRLQELGVAFFNIEGGEPFLVYDRLKMVCSVIDDRSEIWVNSTGDGMTIERLQELKDLNLTAIMFSLHTPSPDQLNTFMKNDFAWDTMSKGIEMCHQTGIPVAFNICLVMSDFYNGTFEKIMDKALEFNAAIIQLIKPKPAGGWLESGVETFSKDDVEHIKKLVNRYNLDPKYRRYPTISAQIIEEEKEMFGCTAGGTDRFYINAKGDVQPCEFLNISFGNICNDDFDQIYRKMRTQFYTPGDCWLCERYSKNVLKIFKEHNLKTLPLNETLSEEIYDCWDRGNDTELYRKIEKEIK